MSIHTRPCTVENIWHQYGAFEESELWRRYAKDSNMGEHMPFKPTLDPALDALDPLTVLDPVS